MKTTGIVSRWFRELLGRDITPDEYDKHVVALTPRHRCVLERAQAGETLKSIGADLGMSGANACRIGRQAVRVIVDHIVGPRSPKAGLSRRTFFSLWRAESLRHIADLDDRESLVAGLGDMPIAELLSIKGFGRKSFVELVNWLGDDAPEHWRETLNSCPVRKLSASEALFGFMGWLTSRSQAAGPFSGKHDAGAAAELVDEFCRANGLAPPRDGWADRLTHPTPPEGQHG